MTTGRINQVTTLGGDPTERCGSPPLRRLAATRSRSTDNSRVSFRYPFVRSVVTTFDGLARSDDSDPRLPASVRLSDARCESEIYKTTGFVSATYRSETIVRDHLRGSRLVLLRSAVQRVGKSHVTGASRDRVAFERP
jgi:hypothetical protein